MARRTRTHDWAGSDFGAIETWPATLRCAVDLVLDSKLPMMLGWGPDLRLFYNDGYMPILGDKHPALGETCESVFGELWPKIGPILQGVYASGEAVSHVNELLPLERHGFLEECYFIFSYSPVRAADGRVAGLLSAAVETTREVVGARRQRVLHDLAGLRRSARSADAIRDASEDLSRAKADLPFHLLFASTDDGRLRPVASSGASIEWNEPISPQALRERGWPVDCLTDGRVEVAPIDRLSGLAPDPSQPISARTVAAVPIEEHGQAPTKPAAGLVVVGLSPQLPWDEDYEGFVRDVGRHIAASYGASRLGELLVAEAENRYHDLFTHSLDGILIGTPDGGILAANPASCQLLGYSEAEIVEHGRAHLFEPGDPAVREAVAVRARTGVFQGELTFRHRSGRPVPCEVSSRIYRDASGRERTTIIMRDVSARRALEAQLREALKMEAVGKLTGGIAHDFNNLLTVIGAQVEFLQEQVGEVAGVAEDLDVIRETCRRAAALIRRLLGFARKSSEAPTVFSPTALLSELSPLLSRLVGGAVELSFHMDDGVPNLRMSPDELEQIVINLVVNARDAVEQTGSPGHVEVVLAREDATGGDARSPMVRLCVRDTGAGIEPGHLDRVFDAFFTTKQHGTGIGLNTVRRLVEQAGGTVAVQSTLGRGSEVVVRLPKVDAPATVVHAAAPTPPRASWPASVLLVEDQPRVRQALGRILSSAGYEVRLASQGEEALSMAEARLPDLLITDVVMPLMTGPELVRRMRAYASELEVLLISGYTGDEVVHVESLGEPMRFLHKPFDAATLLRVVCELLGPEDRSRRTS